MYADEPPRIVGVNQDVGGSELPIVGLTAVGSLLIMDTDDHRAVLEHTHLGIPPVQRRCHQITVAVAVEPLGFVEDEAQRFPNSSSTALSSFIASILSTTLATNFSDVGSRLPGQPLPNVSPEHGQSRSRQPGKCQSNGGQAERDIEKYASLSERTGYDGIAAIVDDIPDGVCHECQ